MRWIYPLVCALCISIAHLSATEPDLSNLVQVELLQEETTVQAGRPFWVAVQVHIEDGWHSYWKNPGDAGMATSIEWDLPPGFQTSPLIWPTPLRFSVDDMIGFGYEGDITFLVQVMPSNTLAQEPVKLAATVKWLVCSDSTCIPGESEVSTSITMASSPPQLDQKHTNLFAEARSKLPNKHVGARAYHHDDLIEIPLNLPSVAGLQLLSATFFPEESHVIDHTNEAQIIESQIDANTDYSISLKPAPTFNASESPIKVLRGIAVVKDSAGRSHALDLEAPIISGDKSDLIGMADADISSFPVDNHQNSDDPIQGSLAMALILALIGGMILNLMPCVLPIVSLKILSFVKMAGQSRSLVLKHGLTFAAGVLVSFWVLAGALLLLQTYGHSVGWGFQLQEPIFVGILAIVLLLLSLNLFGVFELGTSVTSLAGKVQPKGGLSGSFLSGILATAVATPCTGPFLGSAVGFAVSAPAWAALLIFTFLGLGMALPYVILSAFPKLMRFIPRPGPWMITFKEIMGFIMLASVLWLVWVFGAQTSSMSLSVLLMSFLAFGLGSWIYGKWGTPMKSRLSRSISYTATILCFIAGGYGLVTATQPWMTGIESSNVAMADEEWETFSPERVAELQAQGVPVMIDFTAKWCLICQVNHVVLSQDNVNEEMTKRGVVKMKADWTKNDPVITEELRKHGRSGVPLYLFYDGTGEEKPKILPQVLTADVVLDYIQEVEAT